MGAIMRVLASFVALGSMALLVGCAAPKPSIIGTWSTGPMSAVGGQTEDVSFTFNADRTLLVDTAITAQNVRVTVNLTGTYTYEGEKLTATISDGKLDLEGDAATKALFASAIEGVKKATIEEVNTQYGKPMTIKWVDNDKFEGLIEGAPARTFTRKK